MSAELIRRSAGFLKIYFGLPDIPDRMAQIVLALAANVHPWTLHLKPSWFWFKERKNLRWRK